MQHNAKAFCIVAFATVLASAGDTARAAQDGSSLLRLSVSAPSRISYAGQLENVRFGTPRSEATIYRIEHRAPNLTRRWYLAPQSLYGDWIVMRGNQSYNVDVRHRRVVISKNAAVDDQVALADNFGLLTSNYHALLGPSEMIAGRPATTIALMNRYTGQITMRVWIDKQTQLVLEKESYAPSGAVIAHMRFDHIRYANDLPSAIFDAPRLSGFDVVRGLSHGAVSNDLENIVRTAGFKARGPKYLPEGFLPIAGDVSDIKGVRTLHLLYSDGIRTISLFENNRGAAVDLSRYKVQTTRFEDHDARYVQDGPTTLLTWAEAGLHFALVGDLSRNELSRIAASVVP